MRKLKQHDCKGCRLCEAFCTDDMHTVRWQATADCWRGERGHAQRRALQLWHCCCASHSTRVCGTARTPTRPSSNMERSFIRTEGSMDSRKSASDRETEQQRCCHWVWVVYCTDTGWVSVATPRPNLTDRSMWIGQVWWQKQQAFGGKDNRQTTSCSQPHSPSTTLLLWLLFWCSRLMGLSPSSDGSLDLFPYLSAILQCLLAQKPKGATHRSLRLTAHATVLE